MIYVLYGCRLEVPPYNASPPSKRLLSAKRTVETHCTAAITDHRSPQQCAVLLHVIRTISR